MPSLEKLEQQIDKMTEEYYNKLDKARIQNFQRRFASFLIEPRRLRSNQKRCEMYWSYCYAQGRCNLKVGHGGPHSQLYLGGRVWYTDDKEFYIRDTELEGQK